MNKLRDLAPPEALPHFENRDLRDVARKQAGNEHRKAVDAAERISSGHHSFHGLFCHYELSGFIRFLIKLPEFRFQSAKLKQDL